MSDVGAALRAGISTLAGHLRALRQDLADIRLAGPRARASTIAALSVVLAVTLAQAASIDDVWWAGISGFMSSQATRPASIQRAILRVLGTLAGAACAVVAMALFAYDHVALCGFMFVAGTVGVLGVSVSSHGYAWLFAGLTANMIVMLAMRDPAVTPFLATDRVLEVSLGCFAAVVVTLLLAPDGDGAAAPAMPGWTDLLGAQWPALQHAVRSGVTIALLPALWTLFYLPSLPQMAVTVAAVMAVPVATNDPDAMGRLQLGRAELRLLGCLCGGMLGLLCLALPVQAYPPWLALLFAGVWVNAHVGASERGVAYAGIQGCVVFIMTLVQGPGPPASILPGIDRFAGIGGGLTALLFVNLLLLPSSDRRRQS